MTVQERRDSFGHVWQRLRVFLSFLTFGALVALHPNCHASSFCDRRSTFRLCLACLRRTFEKNAHHAQFSRLVGLCRGRSLFEPCPASHQSREERRGHHALLGHWKRCRFGIFFLILFLIARPCVKILGKVSP